MQNSIFGSFGFGWQKKAVQGSMGIVAATDRTYRHSLSLHPGYSVAASPETQSSVAYGRAFDTMLSRERSTDDKKD